MATWSTTSASDVACRTAVLGYVSAWTKELHRLGYLAGMYANLSSGAKHLSEAYVSPAYARPDALWIARWDGNSTLTGWAGIPNAQWSNHQRGKQYRGDHDETYGGVKINIDSDRFDAPVATVGYPYQVTSSADLNGRSGPNTSDSASWQSLRARCDGGGGLPDRWLARSEPRLCGTSWPMATTSATTTSARPRRPPTARRCHAAPIPSR